MNRSLIVRNGEREKQRNDFTKYDRKVFGDLNIVFELKSKIYEEVSPYLKEIFFKKL